MAALFAEAAERAAGLSAWLLGWRPQEFWTATPAELAVGLKFLIEKQSGAAPLTRAEVQAMQLELTDG